MQVTFNNENIIRYVLGSLLLLIALNAFAGGYYGMTGVKDIPVEWLNRSPFNSYFIPSLFLFVVIGGSTLFAAIVVFKRKLLAKAASLTCSIVLFLWIAVQVMIIGYVSWMQPAIAVAAVIILILTRYLFQSSK